MKYELKFSKVIIFSLAFSAIVLGFTVTRQSKANTSTLTGSCGGAINYGRKGKLWANGLAVNSLILINFDTNSFELSTNEVDNSMPKGYALQVTEKTTFKLIPGPISGSYTIVDIGSPTILPNINLLAVNEGKSILLQVKNDDIVGVCQRI